jgi:cyclopropane fatty-acyl-phospholipid synthase-like methyltransferase
MTRRGEPQKSIILDDMAKHKPEEIGVATAYSWRYDPRRILFMLSRYKFVAKMFEGYEKVLEVGCGDGFGTRIVSQSVGNVVGIDFDPDYLESARATACELYPIEFIEHDLLSAPFEGVFDGVFALDVLEHIEPEREDLFLRHSLAGLKNDGACIIGMPSLESQVYASEGARRGHVNCMEQQQLKALMEKYFVNVFMFSANDEIVHTGYSKLAHYFFALCCSKRTESFQ